jgi:hypothetical protein
MPDSTEPVPHDGGQGGPRGKGADGGEGGWTRDYFDDAAAQRARHRLTRRELDELCYFVGLLESGGRWPPPACDADDSGGPFGLATVVAAVGPVHVQHLAGRPAGAGTRDVAVFFTLLPRLRRVRIVNVVDAKRLRRERERRVIVEAAALRALVAADVP